jgi:tetratricopeptide (TPR) repeat protein
MTENDNTKEHDIGRLSGQIVDLIFARRYDQALEMISASRQNLPASELHRLTALTAVLRKETENLHDSIVLMHQAVQENPLWLPHLYRLSIYLMDAKRWPEANAALDQLILLSEKNNDEYFLEEARFRKVMCLSELGRNEEIQYQKDKISPDTTVFIGDRLYGLKDL